LNREEWVAMINEMIDKKTNVKILDGNHAAAQGAKLSRVQVIAAYPITPATPVTETLSEFVEGGELNAEYIAVESEHSALTACASASMVGARTFTATSSQGLTYMHEVLHWAAGTRLPLVLACANRAIGAPLNILPDHQDSISQRDTGWIQIYARNNQEILDSIIQAYKIAEAVYVPVMVSYDGFVLSHSEMPVDVPLQEDVDRFLPPYQPHTILDPANPKNYNQVTTPNPKANSEGLSCPGYMELRYLLHMAMEATVAADMLRAEGKQVGVLGLRVFRPFPKTEMVKALRKSRLIVVFDRNISYGLEGASCTEIKSALYGNGGNAVVRNFIVGLGGRDVKARDIVQAVNKSLASLEEGVLNSEYAEWICNI